MKPCAQLPAADLDHVLTHTRDLWEELRGQRIFITGGTGFFGIWLLETFAHANDRLKLDAQAVVLTRNAAAFRGKMPHLAAHPAIRFHAGDVRDFDFPEGKFSHVIHAATEASAKLNAEQPLAMFDVALEGTRRALEFARATGAKKFLLTSSGAVYGRQPPELTHVPEDFTGGPDVTNPNSAYAEGKRAAETLCALYHRQFGLETKIARCFAFVGPHLPLDAHFAIGNFIRDALKGGPIRVNGDGMPVRSYLYAADLAVWLWTILFKGQAGRPYNVGSEEALSIAQTAENVAKTISPTPKVEIAKAAVEGKLAERYVPSTRRAAAELQLSAEISPAEAVRRTIFWRQQNGQ
jgi:dTDP-glucose 4,6-dehydratase